MQTAAVAGAFPSNDDEPDDVSRDFVGVGAGSILASLMGAFAVDASPPSTAIVRESGGANAYSCRLTRRCANWDHEAKGTELRASGKPGGLPDMRRHCQRQVLTATRDTRVAPRRCGRIDTVRPIFE